LLIPEAPPPQSHAPRLPAAILGRSDTKALLHHDAHRNDGMMLVCEDLALRNVGA
jgi:hypothetical protein